MKSDRSEMALSRASLEEQISAAREEADLAERGLERAEDRLAELEDKLKALPPEGADEELFFALRDPRQMYLDLGVGKRRHAGR